MLTVFDFLQKIPTFHFLQSRLLEVSLRAVNRSIYSSGNIRGVEEEKD